MAVLDNRFTGPIVALCLFGLLWAPAAGAASMDLGSIELRFFSHKYDREATSERLNRLENLVYGHAQNGSIDERIGSLTKAIDGSALQSQQPVEAAIPAKPKPIVQQQPAIENSSSYPKVAELERSILGKTYLSDPVQQRLSRLEGKAFGRPSQIQDLATRVDKLNSYADVYGMQTETSQQHGQRLGDILASDAGHGASSWNSHIASGSNSHAVYGNNHVAPFVDSRAASANNHAASPAAKRSASSGTISGGSGMLAKVSSLESTVFGHTSANPGLMQRINSLELSVFGTSLANKGTDLMGRVNHLWSCVKPSEAPPEQPVQTASTPAPTLQPFSTGDYLAQQNSSGGMPLITSHHHHQHTHHHSSFLGKIGEVVVFAGSAAVGAGSVAVGAGSAAVGAGSAAYGAIHGGSTGYGAPYGASTSGSYGASSSGSSPNYGAYGSSSSAMSSFGNISSGSSLAPFSGSGSSFFSH